MDQSEITKLIGEIQEASALLRNDRRGEALVIYHDVKARTGQHPGVESQLGALCEEFGDIDQAVLHYEIVVEQLPDSAESHTMLGVAYLNAQEFEKAKGALEKAHEINPDIAEVNHGLGVYHMQRSDYESAVTHLERACEIKPRDVAARINLAMSLTYLNHHEPALKHIERARRHDKKNPEAQMAHSDILAQTGDIEAAIQLSGSVLQNNPTIGRAYDHYARLKKFSESDKPFIKRAETVLKKGMPPRERANLLYSLGKMYDDLGDYDAAFSFFSKGNLLRKSGYDLKRDERFRRAVNKAFNRQSVADFAEFGHPTEEPVFVVGMPRSGTTLMERIIASHPQGAGSGELSEIPAIAHKIISPDSLSNPAKFVRKEFTAERSSEYATNYLDILRQGHDNPSKIVDKMPGNSRFLGLIKSLFPNATIIHARRHPLDSCLSCYFQNFEYLRWTVDLQAIGKMYTTYRKSMEYWYENLPEGSIIDVHYEELVSDPETHARRMIDACGLEWDPSVLEFYSKKGVVRTASIAQTRRKIYKTSRARWMNYAKHLGPLVAEITPYLEDGREELAEHGIDVPAPGLLKKLFG